MRSVIRDANDLAFVIFLSAFALLIVAFAVAIVATALGWHPLAP